MLTEDTIQPKPKAGGKVKAGSDHKTVDELRAMLVETDGLRELLGDLETEAGRFFGSAKLLQRVQWYGGERGLLVQIESVLPDEEADDAFERFTAEWWLDNCTRANGAVTVDVA